ncbi:hypothetical protein [Polyangium sp. 6x1]|uniref:hypothetical protein n=1 Tax=Polyangium sp. 6x1 TaxID=3042689 RepID=UPI00248291FD|nr:hypothetical protein [Polyangium sp. 6x1]MDI1446296.1 hypothetical protein [Polyangium sp. 6x1]
MPPKEGKPAASSVVRPHAATVMQPKPAFGGGSIRPPHAATVMQPKSVFAGVAPRPPHAAKSGPSRTAQRATHDDDVDPGYTTFVLAPTRSAYEGAGSDFAGELSDLTGMAEKDIAYLKTQGHSVCPDVIYTGHPDTSGKLALWISTIRAREAPVPVEFVVTAHGSPGISGKIGMGHDASNKPDYRVTPSDLIGILVNSGIEELLALHVQFTFRCCNSAYAPLPGYSQDLNAMKTSILKKSLIASFYRGLRTRGFTHLKVQGFRGYYLPAVKGPKVRTKTEVAAASGTVVIEEDRSVTITKEIFKLKSMTDLDQKCASELPDNWWA